MQHLPKADAYIMESRVYRYSSLRILPFITNLRVLEAMLVTLLNDQFPSTHHHKAFFLKPQTVTNFFKLTVGGERVSGQFILKQLQRKIFSESDKTSLVSDVTVSQELWDQYFKQKSFGQEHMANCFLLSVTFLKLFLLQSQDLHT